MDDLKSFGRNKEELERLVEIIYVYSKDIGMEFRLDKCGILVIRKGVKVRSVGIELPDGEVIKELDEKGYKYLGILQNDMVMETQMKGKVKGEYFRRLKLLLKSKLYSRNLIKAINAWAVAVVRYSASVVGWTAKELKEIDIHQGRRGGKFACHAKGSEKSLMKIVAKDVEEMEDSKTYRKRVVGEREDCLS